MKTAFASGHLGGRRAGKTRALCDALARKLIDDYLVDRFGQPRGQQPGPCERELEKAIADALEGVARGRAL